MPEVTDEQLRELTAAHTLLDGLYRDPKLGIHFKRLVKAKHPDTSIPEVDLPAPIMNRMNDGFEKLGQAIFKVAKHIETREKKDADERDEKVFWDRVDAVVEAEQLTKTGKDDLIKIMRDRKLADPEAAAAILLRKQAAQPTAHSGFTPPRWNLFGKASDSADEKESMKRLFDNPDEWFFEEGAKVFAETGGFGSPRRAA